MVDEKKVKLMTKTEMVRKRVGRSSVIATRFYGSDYVVFQVIKGIMGVCIVFALGLLATFMLNAEEIMSSYSIDEIYSQFKVIIIVFGSLLVVTSILMVLVYTSKYWKSRSGLTEYRKCLKKLDRYYKKIEQENAEQ